MPPSYRSGTWRLELAHELKVAMKLLSSLVTLFFLLGAAKGGEAVRPPPFTLYDSDDDERGFDHEAGYTDSEGNESFTYWNS